MVFDRMYVRIIVLLSIFWIAGTNMAWADSGKIVSAIDASSADVSKVSQKIHELAEQGYQEIASSKLLMDELRKAGFKVEGNLKAPSIQNLDESHPAARIKPLYQALKEGVFKTAFRAEMPGKAPGPTVTIMLEYDALSNGHSCGHNLIATSGLMAALGLAAVMPETPGKLVVLGTPAEELGPWGGKILLLDAGHFDGTDIVFITHPGDRWNTTDKLLSSRTAVFTFKGKASHAAAAPHKGINALNATRLTFTCTDMIRGHLRQDLRIHGIITKGGAQRNIVSELAQADFSIRALDVPTMEDAYEKVVNCAKAGALGTGATLEFEPPPYGLLSPLATSLRKVVIDQARALGVPESDIKDSEDLGSGDLGNVGHVYPTVNLKFKSAPEGTAGHSNEFRAAVITPEAFKATVLAAKTVAFSAYDFLKHPEKVKALKAEFEKEKGKEKKP